MAEMFGLSRPVPKAMRSRPIQKVNSAGTAMK